MKLARLVALVTLGSISIVPMLSAADAASQTPPPAAPAPAPAPAPTEVKPETPAPAARPATSAAHKKHPAHKKVVKKKGKQVHKTTAAAATR